MEIKYSKQSIKFLKKLQKPVRGNIISAINKLPFGDVKKLKGTGATYRLRVDDYRILFNRHGDIIKIEKIGPRGDVYK
ncbi:MAG: type II toxin-antitoxin system RelE/ParE family toxin [bacterium]|nr:type II toxin-antitoxin system RelE/ParE family toxin [bacterium]